MQGYDTVKEIIAKYHLCQSVLYFWNDAMLRYHTYGQLGQSFCLYLALYKIGAPRNAYEISYMYNVNHADLLALIQKEKINLPYPSPSLFIPRYLQGVTQHRKTVAHVVKQLSPFWSFMLDEKSDLLAAAGILYFFSLWGLNVGKEMQTMCGYSETKLRHAQTRLKQTILTISPQFAVEISANKKVC